MRWFATDPRTYVKETRKRRQWMCPWIRKRDTKGAYYSQMMSGWRKKSFRKKICKKTIGRHSFILFKWKLKVCVSTFFFTVHESVHVDTVYQKVLYNSCFFLFLRYLIQKTEEIFCTNEASLCFTQKIISV